MSPPGDVALPAAKDTTCKVDRTIRRIAQCSGTALVVAYAGQPQAPADVDNARPANNTDGTDWPAYGRTFSEQRFSPLDQVNRQNVGKLGLAWSLELPEWNVSSAPVEVDGVIYIAVGFSVIYAVDAVTGKRCGATTRRSSPHKMRMRLGHPRARLLEGQGHRRRPGRPPVRAGREERQAALETQTIEPGDNRYITGAPRVFNGKVIIGHGGADFGTCAAMSAPTTPTPASCSGACTSCPAIRPRASRTRPWKWPRRPGRASGGSTAAAAPPGTP